MKKQSNMKYLLLIICTLLAPRLHAQGVQFEELPLADALRQAGEQGKLVFVDCYTVWCGPCKQMANVEFPKPEAGQYFNARFVNVKFDMERGEGLEVASRYAVNIYPTFLILSPDGGEVNRVIGSAPLGDFIEKVAAAIDSRNDLPTLTAEYATGDMTPERMKDFILVLRGAYRDSLAAVVT
ncbi:MAG: thioredoxin family protein, partial [Odoribacteraceae bacterium]|nr:thioredoxin family protein [Odoribacteraceae bacterium]